MLAVLRITLPFVCVLALLVQFIDGNDRIVDVSESSSDDGESDFICCVYGNCSCHSLDHALANLTSNVLINITTDVTFASLIKLSGLKNVSIIGHDNPTVNCTDAAGIHFTSCHNFTIQGITWDGCGTNSEPGIKLTDSDDITIKYCSFKNSMGQAIALVGVLGDVNISHCNFMYNNYYRGHGTAIHYLSGIVVNTRRLLFTITNCSFIYNEGAKSLVYIKNNAGRNDDISFQFSQFHHNQGVSIYVVNQKLYLHGTILFWNNTADNGAGIYISDHSTVIFGRNSTVAFVQNSANYRGGAIFLISHCSIVFDQNSSAKFNNNVASRHGGAIHSSWSAYILFNGSSSTVFNNNTAMNSGGGAISSYYSSSVYFEKNSTTVFSYNVGLNGGAIRSYNSLIHFERNSTTEFINNVGRSGGGAIHTLPNSSIYFKKNSNVVFSNNFAGDHGGAIYNSDYSYIIFKDHSTTRFDNNTADLIGGALFTLVHSNITVDDNATAIFNNNNAPLGPTIYSYSNSRVIVMGYPTIIFNGMSANGVTIHVYRTLIKVML